jgi:hypothetical protein
MSKGFVVATVVNNEADDVNDEADFEDGLLSTYSDFIDPR